MTRHTFGPIAAHPFNFPHDGAIDTSRVALVIIDLQRDFLAHDGYFARMGYDPEPLRKILPNVGRLPDPRHPTGL